MEKRFFGLYLWYKSLFNGLLYKMYNELYEGKCKWYTIIMCVWSYVVAPISLLLFLIMDVFRIGPLYRTFDNFDSLCEVIDSF